MTTWVVIPWRAGCEHRQRAFEYVTRWWMKTYPDWPVVVGEWPEERGPWRKGCAVRSAGINPAPDDVVVVTDADVVPFGVGKAVAAVTPAEWGRPSARWVMPFRMVIRLTESGTRLAINGGLDLMKPIPRDVTGVVQETYVGSAGGGVVVLRGDVFSQVPIDPRFSGYGQEDLSWSLALHRLAGAPGMGLDPLWHLYHPPQPRMRRGPTTSRGVGSEAGLRLWQRYREATTPRAMTDLIAETDAVFMRLIGDVDVGAG